MILSLIELANILHYNMPTRDFHLASKEGMFHSNKYRLYHEPTKSDSGDFYLHYYLEFEFEDMKDALSDFFTNLDKNFNLINDTKQKLNDFLYQLGSPNQFKIRSSTRTALKDTTIRDVAAFRVLYIKDNLKEVLQDYNIEDKTLRNWMVQFKKRYPIEEIDEYLELNNKLIGLKNENRQLSFRIQELEQQLAKLENPSVI